MDYYEVVKKLIGPIEPVGETNTDNARFENLVNMIDLMENMLADIADVAERETAPEYSVSRAGKEARKFLKSLGEIE